MPNRKISKSIDSSRNRQIIPEQCSSSEREQLIELIQILQQKVISSPAFNGGFDTLLVKVEKIDESQAQMGTKISSIHEAVYHPDNGLFARVKEIESVKEKIESVDRLEKEVMQLQQKRIVEEKAVEKETKLSEEQQKLVKEHSDKLRDLVEFKQKISVVSKWLAVTLATGGATLVGKIFFDFVQGHISVH